MNVKDIQKLDYSYGANRIVYSKHSLKELTTREYNICHDSILFKTAIGECNLLSKHGSSVTVHDKGLLDSFTKIMLFNTTAGIAVSGANINSMFRTPFCKSTNIMKYLLMSAYINGGTKCDCYNTGTKSMNLLCKYGMIPVCKVKFDSRFSTLKGNPDIVFFKRANGNLQDVLSASKKFEDFNIPYLSNYVEAFKYRDSQLAY